jgi:hypothetical protein
LYFALEDGERRLQSRFRSIMHGQPIPQIDYITRANRGDGLPMIREYLGRQCDHKPLVIVDTFGKIRPRRPAGVDPYQWDYDVCAALKDEVDQIPGASLLVVHHARKSESADFIDSASGTAGITGAFDFVLVLHRVRHSVEASISVTGRDIAEAEYGLTIDAGRWQLDGATFGEAAEVAKQRRERGKLDNRSLEVIAFVANRAETRAADLKSIDIDQDQARVYLNRLAESGRIQKIGRGLYRPVTSVTTVTDTNEDVTDITDVTPFDTEES